ncbi:MAG: hypothetical protein DRJ33_05645 [Candidatus Methanomethylicota archaeon]|uniref:Uncharacterized protein n=1 Tax=Thermoproteota archaeon TaxID=2056631 RepID=A0A497EWT3_9CREN|nr:MAG: hypothetical protein DRJ33_05645 [Candidatus Verstraetearchaeota archaeon]
MLNLKRIERVTLRDLLINFLIIYNCNYHLDSIFKEAVKSLFYVVFLALSYENMPYCGRATTWIARMGRAV